MAEAAVDTANAEAVDTGAAAGAAAAATEQAAAGAEATQNGQGRAADGKFAGKAAEGQPAGGQAQEAADWRERFSAGDEKAKKVLGRYNSEADVVKALLNAQETISKGGHLPKPPADDAPDEVKAEWRKIVGIPDSEDKYEIPKVVGLELGDGDKPFLDMLAKNMHADGVPQSGYAAALKTYGEILAQASEDQRIAEDNAKVKFEDILGEEWGKDYRTNLAMGERYLASLPGGVGEKIRSTFDTDPDVMRWAASQARLNGYLPRGIQKGGADPAASIGERMAELERQMADPKSDYNTNPKVQDEYVELADQQARLKRNAA